MNRLYYILLATLISFPAIQALDIKTDASCKKLVTAIEQGQKLEKCSTAWQNITQSKTITTQDQQEVLDQALQLAQTQKTTLEQELVNLGDETKDLSKIKWGRGQLALGSYFFAGALLLWVDLTHKDSWNNKAFAFATNIFYPESLGIQKDPTTGRVLDTKANRLLAWIAITHGIIINHFVGPYLIYRGYHNLKQGLNYKQFLQDKITNLDAIITYLQDLQINNQ